MNLRLILAISIAFVAIAALLSILSIDASASPNIKVKVLTDEITGCLRQYGFNIITHNTCWALTSMFDDQPILPGQVVLKSGSHTITFDAQVWTDWGLAIDQYIWLPNNMAQKSPIVGDPVLPHTVTISYTLQSICGSSGCGIASFEVRLLLDVYGNSQKIFENRAENGATKQGVVTVVITNTQYSGIKIGMSGDGGANCNAGKKSSRFSFVIQSVSSDQCEPQKLYYQPVQQGALELDAHSYARWVVSDTNALVYAPTAGIVERVDQENYLVRISSTQIGEYWVSNVRAPENLAGMAIPAGCAMGFYNQPGGVFSPTISVATDRALTPSVGAYLTMIPDGGPCTESWKCYTQVRRGAVSGILNEPEVTITLPARLWPGFDYYLDFSSRVISGAISFRFSNPRGETYAVVEIRKPPPSNSGVWGPGILQLILPDKADYVVSPTTFVEGDNRLWWKLNPTGAADLHQVCISGLSGGELVGVCPPPGDNQWNLGDGAIWENKKARLTDGGWIWKEATIFLPPSPSAAGLPEAAGVSSTEVDVAAISGKYEARVLVEPLQGSPTLYFEKELAPGVWKTLDVISVTRRAYYNLVTQFDTGQQYLTIRLRASGGELRIHEVCSEEEQRESEIVAPCFGIEPYNPPPLTCNLLECPVEQVKYQMQKLHDVALLPPLCKIAYWINNMYYHALTTVGKPILQYLTTIQELIRQYGFVKGIVEALEVLLRSLWISLIKPYGTLLVNWLWGVLQPVLDFLGVSEYTLKLLQRFFYLLYTLFRKAFVILANGTVGLVRAAWLGFKQGLTATPTTPPVPPESIQLGMELIGYSVGNVLIIPLIVIFTGIMMWQFFFWSLKVLGIVK
jgi:hypothetical protein